MNWRALVQTKKDGEHDILPVAGRPDHARVPVMMPRPFDSDMRRDETRAAGSSTQAATHAPSMSAEGCTAHQDSTNTLNSDFATPLSPAHVTRHARSNVQEIP